MKLKGNIGFITLGVFILAVGLVLASGTLKRWGKYAPDPRAVAAVPQSGGGNTGGNTGTTGTGGQTGGTTTGTTGPTTVNSGGGNNTGGTNTGGTNTSGTTTNTGTNTATQPAAPQKVALGPLAKGATATVGTIQLTLEDVNVINATAGLPKNYRYVLFKLTVKNTSGEIYTVNVTDHFSMENPEGRSSRLFAGATAQRSPRLQGTLEQNKSVSGWLGYLSKAVPGTYKLKYAHPDWGTAYWEVTI